MAPARPNYLGWVVDDGREVGVVGWLGRLPARSCVKGTPDVVVQS